MEKKTVKRSTILKGIGLFIGVVVIVILLVNLFQPKPSEAVEGYLTQMSEGNYEEAVLFLEGAQDEATDEDDEMLRELMQAMFAGLTYEIVDETRKGDEATVQVKVDNVDIRPIFATVVQEMMIQALEDAFSEDPMSEEEMNEQMYETLRTEMAKEGNKRMRSTVDVNMVKVEGEWKIAQGNDEFMNAISGGMNEVGEAFEEMSTE